MRQMSLKCNYIHCEGELREESVLGREALLGPVPWKTQSFSRWLLLCLTFYGVYSYESYLVSFLPGLFERTVSHQRKVHFESQNVAFPLFSQGNVSIDLCID